MEGPRRNTLVTRLVVLLTALVAPQHFVRATELPPPTRSARHDLHQVGERVRNILVTAPSW